MLRSANTLAIEEMMRKRAMALYVSEIFGPVSDLAVIAFILGTVNPLFLALAATDMLPMLLIAASLGYLSARRTSSLEREAETVRRRRRPALEIRKEDAVRPVSEA